MAIERFQADDIPAFLALATREGWLCDPWELEHLLAAFPEGCLVWRQGGEVTGFVTASRYRRSGWIGNLLVSDSHRHAGIGSRLFRRALEALEEEGAATVWLTASPQGRPLYARHGFRSIDTVCRWRGWGGGGEADGVRRLSPEEALPLDRAGWGDERLELLQAVAARGAMAGNGMAFRVLQPLGEQLQLGPVGGTCYREMSRLVAATINAAPRERTIFLDVPAGSVNMAPQLMAAGFRISGITRLMCRGEEPAYCPERIGALASMGSFG
jgi:predicted N-acetyltransferase YhbS